MPNNPRRPLERDTNTIGGEIGVGGVGENTGGGRMALGTNDPHTARERQLGPLGSKYKFIGRGGGIAGAGDQYAREFGSNTAQILEGISSFCQRDAGKNYYGGSAQGGYGHSLGIRHTNAQVHR